MPRVFPSQPSGEPRRDSEQGDVRTYHYDPNLGNPRDAYTRADLVHPEARRPEIPARFVARVEGETIINTMWGKRIVRWKAEPGTQCVILGYWADGTVHLRWPAIVGTYRVDGRFPAWVVVDDPTAIMAGGGLVLAAHEPDVRGPALLKRLLRFIARFFFHTTSN
jgi:hypothetical protein